LKELDMFQKRVRAVQLAVCGLALAGFSSLAMAQVGMQGLQAQMGQTGQMPTGVAGTVGMAAGGSIAGGLPSIRSAEALANPTNTNNLPNGQLPIAMPLEPLKPNDFQKFVLETTGQKLPVYGQAFFENLQFSQRVLQAQQGLQTGGAGFAPIDSAPVSGDYLLGPGDQLAIRGWGSLDMDVRATVDRKGVINVPRVGAISLVGVKASQADEVVQKAIGKYYKDFQVSVTLVNLRSITVYVVGQARRPGSYTISGVSTLASGLLSTGGPGANGSMRHVQLKRAGQLIKEFDLYAFLAQGDSVGDVKLVDGDVIVIPPATGYVALVGKVNNPAVYEIKSANETIEQLLAVAGGLPVVADPKRVSVERLNPNQAQPRSVEDFALDAKGLKTPLKNGDVLTVQSILPELGMAVTLRGNVAQPVRLAWKDGMRVRDLIPNKEALISRDSIRKQNEALFDTYQRERAQREREMIPEDLLLDKITGTPQGAQTSSNVEKFKAAREARLFSQQAPIDARSKNEAPSVAETVGNLYDEINWDYALVERLNRSDLTVSLVPFNLSKALADDKDPENIQLQAGDIVTVFSVDDVRVPIVKRRVMIRIEGEVMRPGIYQVKPGETLQTVLQNAGGLSGDAYLYGSGLYREDIRKAQVENLQKLLRRMESESAAQLATMSQSVGASSDANVLQARIAAAQQAQRQALERMRSLRPEGRVALGLEPELGNAVSKLPDMRMQNGDRFVVPARPDFIYVYGSVNTESALLYKSGQTVSDYLKVSGMGSAADKDSVILLRADGSAVTGGGWFNSVLSKRVLPGDSIIVPDKLDMEATWSAVVRNTKDITQIFYQLGLGAAAIKTLKN
jgi:protein involved in polysaccharide export with SLBB domain